MITRDQIMEFFRQDDWIETVDTLSLDDKTELLFTISQSVDDRMEGLISYAIETYEGELQLEVSS